MPAQKELITPTFREPKELNTRPQSLAEAFERATIKELIVDWSRHGVTFGGHHDFVKRIPFDWASKEHISGSDRSSVYKTYIKVKCNEKTDRIDLAIKEVELQDPSDEYLEQRLEEVKIIKRLRHKHIIELLGSYTESGNLNLLLWPVAEFTLDKILKSMDSLVSYIEEIGREGLNTRLSNVVSKKVLSANGNAHKLSKFLRDEDPSVNEIIGETVRRLFQTFGCLAEAITYLHGQRVRHRDIKPANILICIQDKNFVRLTDFGIADDLKDLKTTKITFDGKATDLYLAPEQKDGIRVGFEADVFSLGIVYLEVVVALGMDLFIRDKKAQVKILKRTEFFESKKLDDWSRHWSGACQFVYDHYQRDLSFLVKQLLQLIQGMLEETAVQRLKGNQILTRLGIIEQLCRKGAKAGTSVSLFAPCCKAQILQREDYVLLREAFEVDGESRLAKQGPLAPSTQGSNPADYAAQDVENACSSDTKSEAPENQFVNNVPEVPHLLRALHVNGKGERIDPPFDCQFNDGANRRVKSLKFCYKYILLDYCESGDACGHRHTDDGRTDDGLSINHPLMISSFRRFLRSQKCNFGLNCNNATCVFGHNCSFTKDLPDPSDPSFQDLWVRTATTVTSCLYGGPNPTGKCKFPIDMHNIDGTSLVYPR